jgi:uncharacterized membrane protein YphA (DoxX/SURF4 family)
LEEPGGRLATRGIEPKEIKTMNIISWIARIVIALILLQTLFFKFTGAEESKYIFSTLMGAEYEAFGRIGSGLVELVAAVLILLPRTAAYGGVLTLATISGAIFSHLTRLGIVVQDDGGTLFGMAITVLVLSLVVLFIHRRELPIPGSAS